MTRVNLFFILSQTTTLLMAVMIPFRFRSYLFSGVMVREPGVNRSRYSCMGLLITGFRKYISRLKLGSLNFPIWNLKYHYSYRRKIIGWSLKSQERVMKIYLEQFWLLYNPYIFWAEIQRHLGELYVSTYVKFSGIFTCSITANLLKIRIFHRLDIVTRWWNFQLLGLSLVLVKMIWWITPV